MQIVKCCYYEAQDLMRKHIFFSPQEPAYNPQVEAISPTLPPEETLKAQKIKEEISEKLNLVEREIAIAKQQIQTKKKKLQVSSNPYR